MSFNQFVTEALELDEPIERVLSDSDADGILDKIKHIRSEKERFVSIFNDRTAELKLSLDSKINTLNNQELFLMEALKAYFEGKDIKPTKAGTKSYKLLSGTLKLKKQAPEYLRDDDTLAKFLKENGMVDYYTEKAIPKWNELKPIVCVCGESVIDVGTGLKIEGVTVKPREDKFEVDV